jgi:lysophospholipase L1-like esterase
MSTTVGNLSTTVGNLGTTVGNLSTAVDNNTDAISSINGNITSLGTRIGTCEGDINNLGNTIGAMGAVVDDLATSVFSGKKLAIYGDSISTFAGYIPAGNATYYTGTNADVATVDDTWWKKVVDALGLDLLVNNSWSGRAVSSIRDSQSGHTTDAGYKQANIDVLGSEGTPEIIIIKLGINDFNQGALLGDYDGSTTLPSDPTKFTDAYAMMLDRIMTTYPLAKVYCCTLMQCERTGSTGFPETNSNGDSLIDWNEAIRKLAEAFGCEVLNHASCGITYYNLSEYTGDYDSGTGKGLHPNADGMSLIANQTIHEMDNTIRTRY